MVRVGVLSRSSSHASVVPVRATRKLAPVIPIHGIASAHGVSAVAKTSRPNGMPLKGNPLRHVSTPTHHRAARTGHARARRLHDSPMPSGTKNAASSEHIAIHASVPTARIQTITAKVNAMPNSRLGIHASPGRSPRTESTSTAMAGGISHAWPIGSNAAASTSPPTTARRQRTGTDRP